MKTVVVILTASLAASSSQQAPPRDAPVSAATGTAVIRGVIVGDGATRRPIRRARVLLSGAPLGRTVMTDDAGGFVFAGLPAGNYTLNASKPAYLATAYGAAKPGRAGTTIVLADKQIAEVSMTMSLGGVVGGMIRDARGRPMAGIDVGVIPLPTPSTQRPSFVPAPASTDDRGAYRLYGVTPGQYYVAAVTQNFSTSAVSGRRSVEENDALLAQLQTRASDGSVAVPGAEAKKPEPLPTASAAGFAPVFYPGTARAESASVVTVAAGEERLGVDFIVAPVRAASIDGSVQGPVRNLDRVELSLVVEGPQFPPFSSSRPILAQRPDARGRFHYENMPPGRYSILARALAGEGDASVAAQFQGVVSGFSSGGGPVGRSGGAGASMEGQDYVYGRADVDIDGASVSPVSLVLMPGVTATGNVVFDRTTATIPADLTQIRFRIASVQPTEMSVSNNTAMGNNFLSMPFTPLRADGSWIVRGVPPSSFNITTTLPAAISKDWWLRSTMLGDRDLLDGPFDVLPGQDLPGIVFTLTDRRSELGGSLTAASGQPATDYFVIVLPSDPRLWSPGSRRIRSARPGTDGRFTFKDLPAGEYLLAALTDVTENDWNDPQFLAAIATTGVTVSVADGETKVQNLRVGARSSRTQPPAKSPEPPAQPPELPVKFHEPPA